MARRFFTASVLVSALTVVVATAGYAFSQSDGWDIPSPKPDASRDVVVGPPAPADLAVSEVDDAPMVEPADVPDWDGAIPEIALRLLYGPDFDPTGFNAADEAPIRQIDPGAAPRPDETDIATRAAGEAPVRMIDLPSRDDSADSVAIVPHPDMGDVPILETTTDGQQAGEPTSVAVRSEQIFSPGVEEVRVEDTQIAPIPAPVSRRPAPPEPANLASVQPVRSVTADPIQYEGQGTWPRRLDQVNALRGPESRATRPVTPDNLFMSDWVEVRTLNGSRIMPRLIAPD